MKLPMEITSESLHCDFGRFRMSPSRFRGLDQGLLLLLFFCSLFYPALLFASDVSVDAQLNSRRFPIDRPVLLTVTVSGSNSARPEEPKGDGLQFTYKGQNSQMQWINGKSSSSVSYVFLVEADQPGEYTIEPVTVHIDSKSYTTKPIKFTVLAATMSGAPATGKQVPPGSSTRLRSEEGRKIGFIQFIPEKESVYAGEQVSFVVKALVRQGIRVSIKSQPRLTDNNFIIEHLDDEPVQGQEVIEGIPYTSVTWHGTLSAIKQGTFPMEVEMDTTLLVREQRQLPSSMFGSSMFNDPFFDSFFSGFSEKNITLISPKQNVVVKPLPEEGKPADFNGAIGTFSLAVNAQPNTVQAGDPITLKMIIQGSGNFDRVRAPVFPANDNWKTYPPSSSTEDTNTGGVKKEFEQAIVPLTSKAAEIPPLHFSYFDPEAGNYITLSSDPIPIDLQGTPAETVGRQQPSGKHRSASAEPVSEKPPSLNAAMAPNHTDFGKAVHSLLPLYRKGWFQLMVGLSLLLSLVSISVLWHSHGNMKNPAKGERQILIKELQRLLKPLQEALENNDSKKFLALSRLILQKRYGFLWQIEPQVLSAKDFDRRLGKDSPITTIFSKTEHAAYTGGIIGQQEMQQIFENIKEEIQGI